MIQVEFETSGDVISVETPEAAAWAIRRRVSITHRFEPFCVTFSETCEVEWTDPDLWIEEDDAAYFVEQRVPAEFVKILFINPGEYLNLLKPKKTKPKGKK